MHSNNRYTLKSARAYRNLTQQDLADRIGIHVNTYAYWERHPEKVKIRDAIKIAAILDISLDDIVFAVDTTKCS